MSDEKKLLELARDIATSAHAGQVDKTGHAYITHPTRVAERVCRLFPDAPSEVQAAALLHDVLEDTSTTADDLVAAGIPQLVVDAVDAVTKRDHEPAEQYFARVRANPWAVQVKTADIEDNTDPDRVAQLDPATRDRLEAKYTRSRALLAGGQG
jgi:(p)ppGpp synthase/HD superfamily hydrolase